MTLSFPVFFTMQLYAEEIKTPLPTAPPPSGAEVGYRSKIDRYTGTAQTR